MDKDSPGQMGTPIRLPVPENGASEISHSHLLPPTFR
jgi:hypothetical protein